MGLDAEYRALVRAAALALILGAFAAPAAACRLALMLALDISASVDPVEDSLQRQGLARALTAPDVQAALLSGADPVALLVFEWSGRNQQDMILPWVLLDSTATINDVAARIAASQRSYAGFPTGVGRMLEFSSETFAQAPRCDARTLDVSGDGVHNDGPPPHEVYGRGTLSGVTVNGLAIEVGRTESSDHADEGAPDGLAAWYRAELIRGPGAFVEVANGFEGFERAMRRKLVRETAVQIGALTDGLTDEPTSQLTGNLTQKRKGD